MDTLINPPVHRLEAEIAERWTHDDFMLLAPDNQKAELINGEMIMTPPPFYEHERLQSFLFQVIGLFVSRFDLGEVLGSRMAVYISDEQTYEPDLLFVSKARVHIITRKKLLEAPDLIVEILSPTTARHDRGVKLENYARGGVRELWLIDPYGPAGTQFYQRRGENLVEIAPVDGLIFSNTLPNFKLKTAWLWPDAENHLANPYAVLKALGAI